MARKLTYEEVKNYIEVESDSGCKLLSKEYVNSKAKLKLKCHCGNIFTTTFNEFKSKNKVICNSCSKIKKGKKLKTPYKKVKEEFNKKGYILIDKDYIDNQTDLKYICSKHKDKGIQKTTLQSVKRNKYNCHWCQIDNGSVVTKYSYNYVKDEFDKRGYILISKEYINADSKLQYICPKHKDKGIQEIKFAYLNQGQGCPYCYGNVNKTTDEFIQEVYDLVGDEYTVLGEYINNKTKINLKHEECGYIWNVVPNSFLNGRRCPKCASSKGEKKIRRYLERSNVKFIEEYRFKNCRNKLPLPFDFYLPNYNLLIEYDGEQHYEPTRHMGADKKFKQQQKHDNIKNTYCLKNNIKLIRIPYWDFDNIEEILDEALSGKDSAYFIA